MAWPANVIHDFIPTLFCERFTHAARNVIQNFIPGNTFPLSLAAFADSFERVTNTLGIIDLIEGRRPLSAVAPAAAGMFRIALEAANCIGILFNDGNQAACRFAIETDCRNDPALLFDFARPLRGIIPVSYTHLTLP